MQERLNIRFFLSNSRSNVGFDSKTSLTQLSHIHFFYHTILIFTFSLSIFLFGNLEAFSQTPYKELTASDYGTSLDYFGGPIALEGNTAAITAMYNENSGSVYIFEYDNGEWTEKQKLCGDDTRLGDRKEGFGYDVEIFGDTLVVSALGNDEIGADFGAAYVFERNLSGTWYQTSKLLPNENTLGEFRQFANFGRDIDIDEDTIVVGAYSDDAVTGDGLPSGGAAYVFVREGNTWIQQQRIVAPDASSSGGFGYSVEVEGNLLLIADGVSEIEGLTQVGSVYFYTRDNGVWTFQQKFSADVPTDYLRFGHNMTMNNRRVAIGTYFNYKEAEPHPGSVYVFNYDGCRWNQHQVIHCSDVNGYDSFGQFLDFSGDKIVANAVENHWSDGTDLPVPATYLFTQQNDGLWVEQQKFADPDGYTYDDSDYYGRGVAIDGNTVMVGDTKDDHLISTNPDNNNLDYGKVYVFDIASIPDEILIANNDCASTYAGVPVNVDVLANDVLNGSDLFIYLISEPANGTVDLNDDGTFTYTPDLKPISSDQFTYQLISTIGANEFCAIADVNINISLLDENGPLVKDISFSSNPIHVNTCDITLSAVIDDSQTGGSNIQRAYVTFTPDDPGSWLRMDTVYGDYDSPIETVSLPVEPIEAPGVYEVSIYGVDEVNNWSQIETSYLVVYDPEGQFVTGGGWIESPPGAYIPDVSLSGKADFGFVSKYKKGATVPDGQTEFHFKVADLNFHSASYDWLVVAGSKAMFKGIGAINGEGEYGFLLTAIDGDLKDDDDAFRIKIWDKDSDQLIYDNKFGSDDYSDEATILGGGNIVIHK